jgi:ribosomal protein L30/L7E
MQTSPTTTKTLQSLSLEELTTKADFLKQLCLNLDPYAPMDDEQKQTLLGLGLKDINDPFRVTNELIMQMENVLEEIQKRQNKETTLLH